ncbi:MAG: hypothetical protein JO112_10385 [Planctomycetes bacterium]|nr:hypothetical protein [Planctomycetota bacterium]
MAFFPTGWQRWRIPLALMAWALLVPAAPAAELYFMAVFGSQRGVPTPPRLTHSFAVFVKATGEGPAIDRYQLEYHTISWMPQTLDVEIWRLLPEPGINLDLHATIRWALAEGQRVSMWGPFQIRQGLYDRALCQIAHLNSGEVRYKAVDTGYPTERVSNCIHAVSDLSERNLRLRVASPGFGEVASYLITRRLESWILNPQQIHYWVADRLGLGCYPIIHRELERGLFRWRHQFGAGEVTR